MAKLEKQSRQDVFAGGIFIAIAALFAIKGTQYAFGTPLQMGPGFFPVLLAAVLAVLGTVVAVAGFRDPPKAAEGPVPWRGMALICASLAVFAAGARPLGLVPVVLICTFMTATASRRNTAASAAAISVVMATLCYLIFKVGLAVTLPTFGPVFGF